MIIDQPRYEKLPEHFREPVRLYVEQGVRPGDMITAILNNNLLDACCWIQPELLPQIKELVLWFHWEVPALSWGSPIRVWLWTEAGGANGIQDWPAYNERLKDLEKEA